MYGQWINIYSKVDKKTFTEVSFDEFINIIFINKSNKVKYVDSFRNMFRGNIGKLFKIDKGMVKWSQNEFNSAVTLLTEGETKKSFYEKILN